MIRRTLTSAVVAIGMAALLPLGASAKTQGPVNLPKSATAKVGAAVAGTCNLSVPTRVAIGRPYVGLPAKVTGNCTQANSLSGWNLYHPSLGAVDGLLFDNVNSQTWDVYSDYPIGVMTWRGLGAFDGTDNPLTQNAPSTTVKLATGAWISSSRTADVVTLKGTALLYSHSNNTYFKRSAAGVFQFRERGTTTWQTLKAGVWTNSKGEVTMAYRYSKTRDYRFAVYSTSISWDTGSAVTTR
jgi:hypothetical protein